MPFQLALRSSPRRNACLTSEGQGSLTQIDGGLIEDLAEFIRLLVVDVELGEK